MQERLLPVAGGAYRTHTHHTGGTLKDSDIFDIGEALLTTRRMLPSTHPAITATLQPKHPFSAAPARRGRRGDGRRALHINAALAARRAVRARARSGLCLAAAAAAKGPPAARLRARALAAQQRLPLLPGHAGLLRAAAAHAL